MKQINYLKIQDEILESIKQNDKKPTLLLHSCCAPCNCYPMIFLSEYFDVTLYFNNSNIYPYEEYQRRLDELKNYIVYFNKTYNQNIQIIVKDYNPNYQNNLLIQKNIKEGYGRCWYCYATRMNEAYNYAEENNFDYFTTVMTISRQKNSKRLNEIGAVLSKNKKTKYFYSDLKKRQGIDKSVELSTRLNMYKQQYCGCQVSYEEYLSKGVK